MFPDHRTSFSHPLFPLVISSGPICCICFFRCKSHSFFQPWSFSKTPNNSHRHLMFQEFLSFCLSNQIFQINLQIPLKTFKKFKVESEIWLRALKMRFDLDIRAKRTKTVLKLLQLLFNRRPRFFPDLIRRHVHTNSWHVSSQVVKKFFICYPQVRLATMATVQPIHGTNTRCKFIET